ncbi:hypothetical protein [Fibrobacter sp.]|uniref:hypothetical protein n=1 Tax=Fibrobacter sp. TaxID=35828 RepID=UPI00386CC7C0
MDDSNNINAKMLGRFAVPGQEIVYKLFDAFLSKTVLEDRLIDFSKPPVEHNDGSVEFEALNAGDGASLPSFSQLILGQPVASVYEFLDEPLLEKPEEPTKPRDLNPPERPGDYKEIKVPKRKKKDTDEEYQAKMLKYEQEVKERDEKNRVRMENFEKRYNEYMERHGSRLKEYEKLAAQYPEKLTAYQEWHNSFIEKNKVYLMIAFHLYWLWSLGANNVAVGCGPYGKLMALEAPIFPDMGLWKVQVLGMRKDLKLIYSIFERILSWPRRPKFNTVAEVKAALVDFILKVRKDSSAQVRNGLLHLCNPEKFTNMYTYQEKVEFVLQHDSALQGYHTSDMAEMNRNDSVFFSKKNVGGKKFDGDYQGLRTEEKIRHIKG